MVLVLTVPVISFMATLGFGFAFLLARDQGNPFDARPPLPKSCKIFRFFSILSLLVFFFSSLYVAYNDGYEHALTSVSPAAYNSGNTTPDEIADFYSKRSNFCYVCNSCRIDVDGEDLGDYEYSSLIKISGVKIWLCHECSKAETVDVSVNGVAYTVIPGTDQYYDIREFLSERSNFCEICHACRYSLEYGEWVEREDGYADSFLHVKFWICPDCCSRNSFDICVDGVSCTLVRDEDDIGGVSYIHIYDKDY